jgi:hypothetical protein
MDAMDAAMLVQMQRVVGRADLSVQLTTVG